jgi:ABC-type transport system involved in multi-copper enzyme maturation permease subunit
MNPVANVRAFGAFFLRELRAAVVNRFIYLFGLMALAAGLVPRWADPAGGAETAAHALLPAALYLIPLFSLLTGIGSAQNEEEESMLLMSQPVGAAPRVLGKFAALWLILGAASLLLMAPSLAFGATVADLGFLWAHVLGAGGIFAAFGLCVGISVTDRVKAYLTGLCLWLVFLVGFDLLALVAARQAFAQSNPGGWIALLMASPLDALRIHALLELGRIPFDPASLPPLGRWWLADTARWFTLLSAGWIALFLAWSWWRLERRRF